MLFSVFRYFSLILDFVYFQMTHWFPFVSTDFFLLQMSTTQLLKHTQATAAASTATDQNAQTTFPRGPLVSEEHSRAPGGLANHCMAHGKPAGFGGTSPEAGRLASSLPSQPLSGEEEDDGGGGGGARVKKKRKKKDKKEPIHWPKAEKEIKPKKKKEQREGKEPLPRKSKEPKKARKPRDTKTKAQRDCKAAASPPKQRGRKARCEHPSLKHTDCLFSSSSDPAMLCAFGYATGPFPSCIFHTTREWAGRRNIKALRVGSLGSCLQLMEAAQV